MAFDEPDPRVAEFEQVLSDLAGCLIIVYAHAGKVIGESARRNGDDWNPRTGKFGHDHLRLTQWRRQDDSANRIGELACSCALRCRFQIVPAVKNELGGCPAR